MMSAESFQLGGGGDEKGNALESLLSFMLTSIAVFSISRHDGRRDGRAMMMMDGLQLGL
jgi:hypothetical protein